MRAQIVLQAILVASLLGSTIPAVAQTGEFGSPVPGQVVHDGWELQDRFQNARSGTPAKPVSPPPASGYYYGDSNSVKPAVGSTTIGKGTKGER
jgi:hypothetical protein